MVLFRNDSPFKPNGKEREVGGKQWNYREPFDPGKSEEEIDGEEGYHGH